MYTFSYWFFKESSVSLSNCSWLNENIWLPICPVFWSEGSGSYLSSHHSFWLEHLQHFIKKKFFPILYVTGVDQSPHLDKTFHLLCFLLFSEGALHYKPKWRAKLLPEFHGAQTKPCNRMAKTESQPLRTDQMKEFWNSILCFAPFADLVNASYFHNNEKLWFYCSSA